MFKKAMAGVHFLCQALEEDYRVFDGAPTSAAGNG